jgi:predicted GIY-YIG superfamily endonuclease
LANSQTKYPHTRLTFLSTFLDHGQTVSSEERFHKRYPRYSKEEFARRGNEIYEFQIRQQIDEESDRLKP